MPFDPFRRFRLRSRTPVPIIPLASEDDTDESSPERDRPRIVHMLALKSPRKSGERHLGLTEKPKLSRSATEKLTSSESTRIALTLDKPPLTERPPKKSSKSAVASSVTHPTTDAVDALHLSEKPTLIRRVTSKLHITIPSRSGTHALRSRPSTRTLPGDWGPSSGPRAPKSTLPASPTLPNSFVSKRHREAALRERGLLPPRKDLSQQEREADERLGCVPLPDNVTSGGSTDAERLKANWLATNQTSESSDSECGPPVPPQLHSTRLSPSAAPPSDADVFRRSCEGKTDLPPAGRPSFCSSAPPLSISSHLEVLHEEPSELPILPLPPLSRVNLPLIVASSVDCPPSPILVESPVSCTFSSHCPGSTLESQSQSSHRPFPERESMHSSPRKRTSESSDRGRRAVGSSLTRLGSRSLSNLRRSVAGSLRVPSSTTLSSADHSSLQAPRAAIDPTMHSVGSILRETRDIQDAESRRLCELAFLD
ncbi:hypothetical protein V8E55_003721 [Tylopilus felleus]